MECEVKILEIDKEKIISMLLQMGAIKTFDGEIETIYYDFPDKKIRSKHEVFRLRRLGDAYILTFKKLANIREEIEVHVDDNEKMQLIITSLGLEVWDKLAEHRISFQLNDIHVDIDTYPEVPPFMEIEAPNEVTLKKYIEKLGFSIHDAKNWGFEELFDYYKIKR